MVEVFDAEPSLGIEPSLGTLLAALEDGTREWREELGDLTVDEVVRRPFSEGPSIGAVLLHMAESEAFWIEEVVGGVPLSEEFKRLTLSSETQQDDGIWGDAPRMPYAEYLAILDEVRERTRNRLRLEPNPARALKPDPNRPGMTLRWALGHVVQHDSYHGGQCVLIKRMLRGGTW